MVNTIDWNLYPKKILDELKFYHRKKDIDIPKLGLPKFIFLCGKDKSIDNGGNRKVINDFYRKSRPDIICVFSEDLFDVFDIKVVDLLSFEEILAEFSDGIILLLESFGTACELGAFSMDDELLEKLLVINSKEHYGLNSFINNGPIKKIASMNAERIKFADINSILGNAGMYDLLKDFVGENTVFKINYNEDSVRLNPFIYELLELVYLFQPIMKDQLVNIYKYIKDFKSFKYFTESKNSTVKGIQITQVLELVIGMGLLKVNDNNQIEISSTYNFKYRNLMFRMDSAKYNKIRATILNKNRKKQSFKLEVIK